MQTTVAIVEDNPAVRASLERMIAESGTCRCVCASADARDALAIIPRRKPEVVIMDIELPDISGIECTARLKALLPKTQVLILTVFKDDEQIFKALQAGAAGYLLKLASAEEIVAAISEVKAGGAPMTAEIARRVIQSFHRRPTLTREEIPALTPRETEILELLAQGFLSKEIADKLSVGYETVCFHLGNIYKKLHVRSRTEAVVKYLSHSANRG